MNKIPSKEEIDKVVGEMEMMPSIKHFEWKEDNKNYSAWEIRIPSSKGNRGVVVTTGDGGMELFNKELKKYLEKSKS